MKTMKCLKLTVAVCVLSLTAFADRREIKVLEQSGPKCAAYCVRYADDKHRPDEVRNRDEIEELFVSDLVREIPDGMFANMPNLRSVTLDGSLKIGSRAFANCPRLEYVIAKKLDLEELPADAFEGCSPACVRIRGGWRPVVEEVRPLYGWSREYWMPMGGDVQGMRRTSDGFYAHDRDGLRLVYYTGTNEVLRLPSSIDGIAVKGIADSAISFGSSVRSLILPPTVEERFDRWPGSNEAGESMVTTVFCEGAVPRGLSVGDAKTQPRRLYARETAGRPDVIHVPPAVTTEVVLAHPEAYRENEEGTALVIGDRAWLLSVKTQEKALVVPATFEGAAVVSLSDEVMRNRTARDIVVPAALRWGWLLDTSTFGEAVRELHDRYAHEPNGVDLSALPADNTKESVDLYTQKNWFEDWKRLDARGDYLQALKAIDAAVATGSPDAKLALINYLRYGRPGLYCIVDERKARELEGGLSPELAANVFMIDSCGQALPDWRQTTTDGDCSFWLRYRALRGDADARRHLGKTDPVPCLLPTLGVFSEDAPATAVKEGEFVGFDIEAKDYCAPQGKGRSAHLSVKAVWTGGTRFIVYRVDASVRGLPVEFAFDGHWLLEPDDEKGLSPLHGTVLAADVDGKIRFLRRPTPVFGKRGPSAPSQTKEWNDRQYDVREFDAYALKYNRVLAARVFGESGVTPGRGRPGRLEPYADDEELARQCKDFAFTPFWYERERMDKTSPEYERHARRLAKARSGEEATCDSATEDRIGILFSDATAEGRTDALPLVVYIAGSGEQGTDLKLMFRQTAVFRTVRDPKFQAAHPCHLLAIMPPRFANRSAHCGYPMGGRPDLQELYADLIFDLNRDLAMKGRQPIRIDRTALVGLGSGGTAAVALALDYPDRYAGVCAMPNAPIVRTTDDTHPGRWWFGTPADWKIAPDNEAARNYRAAGADFRQTFYADTKKANWWDGPFSSDEFRAWLAECFEKGPVKSGRTR